MRVNTSWAFVGNAIYAACQWAVLILLVNALPAADVGQFAYGLAITGPVFVFANVRLRDVLATGVHSPGDFHDYLTARLLTTAAAIAVSIAAGARFSNASASWPEFSVAASASGARATRETAWRCWRKRAGSRSRASSRNA